MKSVSNIEKKANIKAKIRDKGYMIIAGLFGFVVFLYMQGMTHLNPTDDSWLLCGGDLTTHYLGWVGFRNSEWNILPGLTNYLTYPLLTSIIFPDSIPICAIFFKLLRSVLPNTFQYIGFYGMICYVLNGCLSAAIIKKCTSDRWYAVIGSIFFSTMPIMQHRIFVHTALASQWLILFGILILLNYSAIEVFSARIKWALLGGICASIHIYFVLICGIVLLGFLIMELYEQKTLMKKLTSIIIDLTCFCVPAVFVMFILGGFSGSVQLEGGTGYRNHGMNLNGFVNPQGYSGFLPKLLFTEGQVYEGFCYLGLGMLVLLLLAIILQVFEGDICSRIKKHNAIAFSVVFMVSFAWAISPSISFGNEIIYEYEIRIGLLEKILNIFRVTARIGWNCVYLLCIFAVVGVYKIKHKIKYVLLIICLLLQISEVSKMGFDYKAFTSQTLDYENTNVTLALEELLEDKDIKHVVFIPSYNDKYYNSVAIAAFRKGCTINRFYLARNMDSLILNEIDNSLKSRDVDILYICKQGEEIQLSGKRGREYDIAGVYTAFINNEVDEADTAYFNYDFNKYPYLNGGTLSQGIRHISPQGYSYGPLIILPEGEYRVKVYGDGFEPNMQISVATLQSNQVVTRRVNVDKQYVEMDISILEIVSDFQVHIYNNMDGDIEISKITIEKNIEED